MTKNTTLTTANPNKPKRALEVRGKLATALDLIVFEGLPYDEAARTAKFTVRAMRKALTRPHVIRYLKVQRDVLRTSMCGANLLALAEVRQQTDNQNARVAAVKVLEALDAVEATRPHNAATPGVVIHIIQRPSDAPALAMRTIEALPVDEDEQEDE